MAKQKTKDREIRCPITGNVLTYNGRGRPPVFHTSASAADRTKYRASLGK